jgi:hypothetical protein
MTERSEGTISMGFMPAPPDCGYLSRRVFFKEEAA